MKSTCSLGCFLLLAVVLAARADEPAVQAPVIDASDKAAIAANMGNQVVIKGEIEKAEWSSSGKVMNIEFKDAQESRIMAVVFEKQRENMDKAFGGDVTAALTGAKVRIKGNLAEYGGKYEPFKGRPQIIIGQTTQITVVEPPPATAPATQPGE